LLIDEPASVERNLTKSALKSQPKRKAAVISKLIIAIFRGLLGDAKLENLLQQIHIHQKNIVRFIKERQTIKVLHLFRNYSAFAVVLSSTLLVSATNLAAGKETSGFLFGYLGGGEASESPLAGKIALQAGKKNDLAMVQLAQPNTAPDPEAKDKESEEGLMLQGQALVALTSPIKKDPEEDGGVQIYEVQSGDTVSSIATRHNVTSNTILWANEIDDVDEIMPGDKLFILPVSGVSYAVKKSDTLEDIAKKYKADRGKIIAFNDLPANGEIKEGMEIMIPGGQIEIIAPAQPATPAPSSGTAIAARPYESFGKVSGRLVSSANGSGHRFPYGYCTWYVASKKHIPWSGNAGTWLYKAKASGYATGKAPRVGSIMVSSESWWGHVAIVEKVSGGVITISEMNYKGWAKRSSRTLAANSRVIKGFIY
jgi:surface antigen